MMVGKRFRRRLCLLGGDRASAHVMPAAKLDILVRRGLKRRYLIAHLTSSLSGPGKAALMGISGSAQNLDESLTKSLVRTVKDSNRLRVMFKPACPLTEASQRLARRAKRLKHLAKRMHCESTRILRIEAKKEQQTKARIGSSSKKQTPDG